ncbi:DNA translocase FtsK [Fructilactobacillus sanfranciscensis]|uniref:DNA translocase FtsK n=1 Tax=Fructilactobacillus sanfranciscensis TaxID=1625 RepID=UPI000CD46097|nr:DNA translocase FtsK [Fructilactobacillus sanfranciscensis]POH19425.1 cell division protein FtsK [Fructilactobacillus sanfranciscensis]
MDRYDGPAFFRKYFKDENLFKNNKAGQVTPKSINYKGRDNENKIKIKSNQAKQYFIKSKNAESRSNLVEQTKSFHPENHFSTEKVFNRWTNKFTDRYRQAIENLENMQDLILLAKDDDKSVLIPKIDLNKNNDLLSQKKVTTSQEVSNSSNADLIEENENNELSRKYDLSSKNEQKQLEENYENKNENTVDNSLQHKQKHNNNRVLGHSLSDILKDESGLADKLPLFNNSEQKVVDSTDNKKSNKSNTNNSKIDNRELTKNENIQDPAKNLQTSDGNGYFITQSKSTKFNNINYLYPNDNLLVSPVDDVDSDMDDWITEQAITLDNTLQAFHVKGHVVDWTNGPTVTQFQVKLDLGVKVSKVTNLTDDLKMALAAKDIRIEAPIPGKSTVGIEIPNRHPRPVMLSEILEAPKFKNNDSVTEVAMGVDIEGNPVVADLNKMPHALIAGATGSGKSVFINSLLLSLLYHASPSDLRMILIDPKAVELAPYNEIPHLISPVISDPKEASAALKWVTNEMDNRYDRLAAAGVRNIEQYNKKAHETDRDQDKLPYILVVIDELADLMMVASSEVQDYIVRITQKARAAGIHLIVATQRPSVDIVTGTIKNNIPTRIAFMVSSQIDSRTIIDQAGAERLLGKGDMLYQANGANKPERLQGAFVTNKEVEKVTNFVRNQGTVHYDFDPKSLLKSVDQVAKHDEIWKRVLEYIAEEDNVSTSKLQRVFSIGYNRAATIIDDLEKNNFISGQHGSKPRDVYLTEDDFHKLNV